MREEPAKNNPANRLPIVLGTIIVQIGLGTIYTWSLFNQPLVNKFGWQLGSVATTFSITSFALAFSTLFAGRLQERWGIRKLIALSGLVLGIGLMFTSQVSTLAMLYLLAGVVVGYADGTAYITSLSNLIKWFPDRKGLISGVSVSSYGVGSLIFKYVNSGFIQSAGVSKAFFYWGIIVLIMVVAGSFLIREAAVNPEAKVLGNTVTKEYNVVEMLQTKQAYLLFIIFFSACMSGLYLIGIVKDIGVQLAGLTAPVAANAVAMVAIFNTVGRIVLGPLSDKVSRLKVVAVTLLVTAMGVIVLTTFHLNFGIFFACVAAIAFCFGGNITIFPAIVGDFFGLKNHNKNYGIIYQGFGIGALAGSFIASLLGGIRPTFLVISILCILSSIIAFWIRKPAQHQKKGKVILKPN